MSDDSVHFVEDLEERENASPLTVTTMALGEEGGDYMLPVTQACFETGC